MYAIVVDQWSLIDFEFESGHYLLNMQLFDEMNLPLLTVSKNSLTFSLEPWDITWVGQTLTFRNAPRQILVEITFDPSINRIVVDRGLMLFNGVELLVTPNALTVSNNNIVMSGSTMTNNPVAVAIGRFPANVAAAVYIRGVPRYLGNWSRAGAWRAQNMS